MHIDDFKDMFDESFDIPEYKYIPRKIGYKKYLYDFKGIYSISLFTKMQKRYTGGPMECVGFEVKCVTVGGLMPITIYDGEDESQAIKVFLKEIEDFDDYEKDLDDYKKADVERRRLSTEVKISRVQALI